MLRCRDYIFPKTLDEAYELNQKRNNKIIAGNGWLRLGNRQYGTIIDISGLGLSDITETDDEFVIGAMMTLRQLEKHEGIDAYTKGAVRESLRHIVGTQFRNCVTVGGSIWGRFGFSDVLSIFLSMDAYAELFKGGRIPLSEFAKMKYDNDILVNLIVKKRKEKVVYSSFRNQSTDFPVLTCAMSLYGNNITVAIGARPARAAAITGEIPKDIEKFAKDTARAFNYGDNLRSSGEYREHIAEVLIKRNLERLMKE